MNAEGYRGRNLEAIEDILNPKTILIPDDGVKDFEGIVDGGGVKQPGRRMGLIPPQFIEALADVYTYGCKKYAPNNWMRGYAWSKSYDALQRHLSAFWRGEFLDPESKLPHLAHAAWHCATLLFFSLMPGYAKFDDRPFKERENG